MIVNSFSGGRKRCKNCGESFQPRKIGQKVCDLTCAIEWGRKERHREALQRDAQNKKRMEVLCKDRDAKKTLSAAVRNAQIAINEYCRIRDHGKPCISCGKMKPHTAGHHRSVGSCPELRFDLRNINGQCQGCNMGHIRKFQDDTIGERYREGVRERYGQARVDYIEGPHPAKQYRLDDLNRIRRIFKRKAKLYRGFRGV